MPEYLDSTYDLAANTYTAKERSFAVCEVGDAKQPTAFYPQVKIMRWDNECNFSARLVHEESNPEVALVADKVQWIGDAVEAHFYEIGEGKEGGGFEFEIILKEPPKSNKVQMTLQTKGLDFLYQPEITEEEIKDGCVRPENVAGSYAVYHKTMAGNYAALGGKNYLAGKAFHIFRPRIEDAKGNWVWGELNIDEKAGLLTVTIPQDFLDKAVYPVRHAAGLEFGYHTVGASEVNTTSGSIRTQLAYGGGGDPSTPASAGTLNSISFYCRLTSGTPDVCPALYSNVSGSPSARLAYMNTGGTLMGSSYGWVTTDLSYNNLIASTQYWLGWKSSSQTDGNHFYKYDECSPNYEHKFINSGDLWPDPFSGFDIRTRRVSIYATYTAVVAGQATAKRFGGVPHVAVNRGVW